MRRRRTRIRMRGAASVALVLALAVGAVAAPSASAVTTTTDTVWAPLICNVGVVEVNLGEAFTATVPTEVVPGEQFQLAGADETLEYPLTAQNSATVAFGNPSQIEGVQDDWFVKVGNIDSSFVDAYSSGPGAQPLAIPVNPNPLPDPVVYPLGASDHSVVNLVAAMQPPNADAPNPLDPLINGPSPIAGFPAYPETPPIGVFSFGPAPLAAGDNPTANAYLPTPGSGGGTTPTSGTPDPFTALPFTIATSATPGQDATIGFGDGSTVIKIGKLSYLFATSLDLFFFETTPPPSQWSADTQVQCGIDTSANAVPSPNPNYLSVGTGIQIPIVAPPAVTAISPSTGSTLGGNTVTITGTGFQATSGALAADTVSFGGTPATDVTVNSPTSITATAPSGSAGAVDVTVTDPNTGATSATSTADQYTYVTPSNAPVVTAVLPSKGAPFSLVAIEGTKLAHATAVRFGTKRTLFLGLGPRFIVALAPPPATTGSTVDVTVTTKNGTSAASAADKFTYSG